MDFRRMSLSQPKRVNVLYMYLVTPRNETSRSAQHEAESDDDHLPLDSEPTGTDAGVEVWGL